MLIKRQAEFKTSEITPEETYVNRREFLAAAGIGVGTGLAVERLSGWADRRQPPTRPTAQPPQQSDTQTPFQAVTTYNNFYEFGTDKSEPAENAHTLKPRPWTVKVDGMAGKPGAYDIEDILKWFPAKEYVYRHRCVEGWSMVIPWYGFPLRDFVSRFEPSPNAKFVEFTTLLDPKQMPGQRQPVLDWPYVEGLRMDEAMNPLTLFAVGIYQ